METIYQVQVWGVWHPGNPPSWGTIEDYDNHEDAKEHARAEAEEFPGGRVRVKRAEA